ncbi:MAG: hypothetical protein WC928_01965 [Patescibacteria group bacterium]|jgi:hypothetical protein
MTIKRKIFLFHFFSFFILISGFIWPYFFYWSFLLFSLFFVFFAYSLVYKLFSKKYYLYFVLAWSFLGGLFFYSSLLTIKFFVGVLLLLGILLSYYYFLELKRRWARGGDFSLGLFHVWVDFISLGSFFLISSFSYSLVYFLSIKNWPLFLLIVGALILTVGSNLFLLKTNKQRIFYFSAIILLTLSPLIFILFFLPFNYNVLGILITIIYYFALMFVKFYLNNSLTNKKIKYNLIFILMLLAILFLLVKWR